MPAADLVDIKKFRAKAKRPRRAPPPPLIWPLPFAAESALRLLRIALDDLAKMPEQQQTQQVRALMKHAAEDLARGLAAHSERARRDLRETLVRALGPDLTGAEIEGARRALKLLLAMLSPPLD